MGPCHYGKSRPRNQGIPSGAQKHTRVKEYNTWKTGFWARYESISRGQVPFGLAACFESNAISFEGSICSPSTIDHWKCHWSAALGAHRCHNSASVDLCIQDVHFHFKKWKHFVYLSSGTVRQNPVAAATIEIESKASLGLRSFETVLSGHFCVQKNEDVLMPKITIAVVVKLFNLTHSADTD